MQIIEIIEVAMASCLFLFVKSFRIFLWKRIKRTFSKSDKIEANTKKDILIMEYLISIRSSMNAARARIFQFHNGGLFTTKNPIWKITCTYESCRSGISYESQKVVNMYISHITDFLSFLWNDKNHTLGIKNVCCQSDKRCENSPARNAYKIDTLQLKESFFKSLLINSGIEVMFVVPLINEYDLIIGFMTIEYEKDPGIGIDVCSICHSANNISLELNIKV
jgi:hypothetical protein